MFNLAEQIARNQISTQDKEDIDADETTFESRDRSVKKKDEKDCDTSKTLNISSEFWRDRVVRLANPHAGHPKFYCSRP